MTTTLAVLQMRCGDDHADNIARACDMTRQAAKNGAGIVLPPELLERQYFCKTQRAEFYQYAQKTNDNPAVKAFRELSAQLSVTVAVSFYELAENVRFNSVALVSNGEILSVYRKSHIPDGPGYQEKFYFSPGDGGFVAQQTPHGKIGAAICWDQWFPESARIMALQNADVLLYPSAIGDEPHLKGEQFDSAEHWQTVMRGHAAANLTPLAASNRIGEEAQNDAFGNEVRMTFYGSSFIAGARGEILAKAGRDSEETIAADFNFPNNARERAEWGVFRDRRPELYLPLTNLEGK